MKHTYISLKLEPEHYSLEKFENIISEISLLDIIYYYQKSIQCKSKSKK